MKELSIEEKAKAYDEAIKIAKFKIKNDKDHVLYEADVIEIFPELCESEDDRVRKAATAFIEASDHFDYHLGISKEEVIAWLEKQGKIIDGIEYNLTPKVLFKKGDWVVVDGVTQQVTQIRPDGFDTNRAWNGKLTFKDVHLWTIQDAKDGDVLNSVRVRATIIFKEWSSDGKHINAYCALQKGILIKQEMLWDRDFEPAIKEQRETLFKAMADAGYIFDFEKKELKKVEQKSADWSEKDKIIISAISGIISFAERIIGDWYYTGSEKVFYSDIRNWLKSLKPQSHWMPSEEQLNALHWCVMNVGSTEHQVLQELLEQLEKLKE